MLVGEGGQGVQTIAKLLAKAAFAKDYHTSYIPNFGTEQRGGISIAFLQVACEEIVSPKFVDPNVFIILSSRDINRTLRYITKNTTVIYDKYLVKKEIVEKLKKQSPTVVGVDAFELATEKLSERSLNILILGILIGFVDCTLIEKITEIMDKKFQKYYDKKPELKKLNHEALTLGLNLTTA
ncbi:2-oxoacid:acceptor oxidoreductase family protein [Candidatus Dojkabacteria bacterium]|nr:2-oxoacid:acceptor oxidoreductase family protein [Candidatus Dojkabacteria bacterium]